MLLKLGVFLVAVGLVKLLVAFILRAREKRGGMNLGENIKKARKAAGVTQKELAERLQVYQKDISRWENNELTPNAITLAKICRELNASADEILELK